MNHALFLFRGSPFRRRLPARKKTQPAASDCVWFPHITQSKARRLCPRKGLFYKHRGTLTVQAPLLAPDLLSDTSPEHAAPASQMPRISSDDILEIITQDLLLLCICQVAHQHPANHNSGVIEGLICAKNKLLKRRALNEFFQPNLGIKRALDVHTSIYAVVRHIPSGESRDRAFFCFIGYCTEPQEFADSVPCVSTASVRFPIPELHG